MDSRPPAFRKKSLAELGRPSPAQFRGSVKLPLCLLLDNIRSANNVGSLFRTADALALQHLYLCGITATPPHRDILKTALGATESVAWSYHPDAATLLEVLKGDGAQLLCLEQTLNSRALHEYRVAPPYPICLLVGNEVHGVQQSLIEASHGTLEIAQYGTKHSLNVAVAAGMTLWELSRQLRA